MVSPTPWSGFKLSGARATCIESCPTRLPQSVYQRTLETPYSDSSVLPQRRMRTSFFGKSRATDSNLSDRWRETRHKMPVSAGSAGFDNRPQNTDLVQQPAHERFVARWRARPHRSERQHKHERRLTPATNQHSRGTG